MHKRFNIPGFFALIIIALTFFVAVFAYYLAPDSSPYANEMHLELSLLEPQTEVTFIKLRNDNTKDVSFFHRLIYGEKIIIDQFRLILLRLMKMNWSMNLIIALI